jgi:cell wall assembly regulator SMI1
VRTDFNLDVDLRQACERIEGWHGQHGGAGFRPPAGDVAIQRLGKSLGQPMPVALSVLLGLHDGNKPGSYPLPMRATEPSSWRMLGTAEIADEAARVAAVARSLPVHPPVHVAGPVAAQWWSAGWIPFCECGTGDLICIDTAPPAGGTVGQLVLYAHDSAERRTLHASVAAWLTEAADDLEAGRYRHVDGVGLLRTDAGAGGLGP